MKKIMKLSAITMMVTLIVLASSLVQARTVPNQDLETESISLPSPQQDPKESVEQIWPPLMYCPPELHSRCIFPPPVQDPKESVEQFFPPLMYCPPELHGRCIFPPPVQDPKESVEQIWPPLMYCPPELHGRCIFPPPVQA
ncbi:unnamed protein product [Microthlaspi erraticum]|uniref:Uncharacterized protein n=1 Tax=Microthlaspi erraticum TaxID=1685480 RepID=A0A6D2K4H2_9BRAS|nr:unnamed protein product [Microthlaspi erraticum]